MRRIVAPLLIATLSVGFVSAAGATSIAAPNKAVTTPGYAAAKSQWLAADMVGGGVAQNIPFYLAANDLTMNVSKAGANVAVYRSAIAELKSIENLPDAQVSASELRNFTAVSKKLNSFFAVSSPKFQCDLSTTLSSVKTAAASWQKEPISRAKGVVVAPLTAAVISLQSAAKQDAKNAACYNATIADLQSLSAATVAGITHSSRDTGIYSLQIFFLNVVLQSSGADRQVLG